MDVLLAHATEEPPSFRAIGSSVPPGIEAVVQRCLAKDPTQRPDHARQLSEMYEEALASHLQSEAAAQGMTRINRPRVGRPNGALPPAPGASVALPPAPPAESVSGRTPTVADSGALGSPSFIDPMAVVHHLEAWMPEKIATYKLRGFIHDAGGELVESVPGRIQVRLGGKGSVYKTPGNGLSWLLGRRSGHIDMELRLQRAETGRDNQLRIMVVFSSPHGEAGTDAAWRNLCTQIFIDLRGYLMGQTGSVHDAVP
jgi:serine/threonine-protein kinase